MKNLENVIKENIKNHSYLKINYRDIQDKNTITNSQNLRFVLMEYFYINNAKNYTACPFYFAIINKNKELYNKYSLHSLLHLKKIFNNPPEILFDPNWLFGKYLGNNILLHLPHCKSNLPKEFFENSFEDSIEKIKQFNLKITDLYTDELFSCERYPHISPKYSRIYCDVEKYLDDNIEPMAKYGMGAIYTHNINGKEFFVPTPQYKQEVIENYYLPYHKKLTTIANFLSKKKQTILIDCHSFSEDIIMDERLKSDTPDICIGFNPQDKKSIIVAGILKRYFNYLHYSTKFNYPYNGSMIPSNLKNQKNFASVMIEINKKIYLSGFDKCKNFNKLKNDLAFILDFLKKIDLKLYTKGKTKWTNK